MSYLFEFLIVASILVVLTRHKRLRDWIQVLPSKLRLGLVGLMALMLAGQFTRSSELTFPFVFWGMYTKQVHFATRYHAEIEAKTVDGHTLRINPSRLYPSLGYGSLRYPQPGTPYGFESQ